MRLRLSSIYVILIKRKECIITWEVDKIIRTV